MADDLSATLQAIPDLLFEVDEQGRYIKVRASREDLLAAPQGRLLGGTVHDALPPEAARTVMDALAAAAPDGYDYGRVIELPLPIGPRWFELSVARKDSAPGELQHFIVLSRDVTERQRADARLAEREARYRAVIESTSDGFWVVDVNECSIQTANAAYARLSGYSLEELQGLPVADVEVQESHDEVRAHIERIMREGSAVFESRHRARDGHIWPVEVAVSYWPEGGYMFAFVRDISARKTAEAALRESEASYRQLFESSQDAMCILAPPDSRLRDVNRAAVRMFRAESAEQLLTLAPWDVSPERQPDGRPSDEAAVERVRQAMEKGAAFFEWQHQRLDGESFPADVLITRVEQHGETLLQATVRDITERKAAEAELKARNDELERFNHATVGRELDVLEMKKTINALALELGRHPPYPLAFLNDEDGGN